jgi:hypothetical protein
MLAMATSVVGQAARSVDPCAAKPEVPCIRVGPCEAMSHATFGDFKVSNAPGDVPASQPTQGTVCYDAEGLRVSEFATDAFVFSPYVNCNAAVWVASDVLEVFLAPILDPADDPQWYFELDATPTGAMFGSLIDNAKGAAPTCIAAEAPCAAGPLPCSGAAAFPLNMTVVTTTASDYWTTGLFVPWGLFAPEFQPRYAAAGGHSGGDGGEALAPWRTWRVNFYRYDYPQGPNADFTNYELSAWSPTHTPSFHEPSRFGVMVLV